MAEDLNNDGDTDDPVEALVAAVAAITDDAGNDMMHGGPGDDKLYGGAGDDTLNGGPGGQPLGSAPVLFVPSPIPLPPPFPRGRALGDSPFTGFPHSREWVEDEIPGSE